MHKSYHKYIDSISRTTITAAVISDRLGGHRCGNGYMARCPAHIDPKPSLSITETLDGKTLVHCFGGCEQSEVIEALRFRGLWSGHTTGNISALPTVPLPEKTKLEAIKRVWAESKPIAAGDPVDRYLEGRGLGLDAYPSVLRFHPALPYWNGKECIGRFPAMTARVDDPQGNIVSVHRTYLALTGNGKASVPSPKKLMSPERPGETKGAAIQLCEPGDMLAVAEGIETALAVHICTGNPCWATANAGGMKAVVIPDSVRIVVICADRDASATGELAAKALARRFIGEGRRCKILMPDVVGTDWADPLETRHE
jgi:putative DNA primase/helicase